MTTTNDGRTQAAERGDAINQALEAMRAFLAGDEDDDASEEEIDRLRDLVARAIESRVAIAADPLAALDVAERAFLIAGGWREIAGKWCHMRSNDPRRRGESLSRVEAIECARHDAAAAKAGAR